jgi:hypothetical protein
MSHRADRHPPTRARLRWALTATLLALAPASHAFQIAPALLVFDTTETFDTLPRNTGGFSETPIDGVLVRRGIRFGEHFAGQTVGITPVTVTTFYNRRWNTDTGDHETVSGRPTSPLDLQAGAPGSNLRLTTLLGGSDATLGGNTPWPWTFGNGTGAVSVLFSQDQSQFGFEVSGIGVYSFDGGRHIVHPGTLFVRMFDRDGNDIDRDVVELPLQETPFALAYRTRNGQARIAGVTLHHLDPGGLSFDNFRYVVPEPATVVSTLAGLAIVGAAVARRRKDRPRN